MYSVLIIFLLLTISGTLLLKVTTTYNNNYALLASGATLGTTLYIFILNIISKFLPGPAGIIFSTLLLLGLILFLVFKYRIFLPKLSFPYTKSAILSLLIFISIFYFSISKMLSILPAGDSSIQWAYAGSFARGNNPIMVPWQPDFVPGYHLGTYFFEGALQVFSGYRFVAIHALVNILFLLEGSLLTIFMLWENKYFLKNIWLVLASLILFISYGVVIILYPDYNFFTGFLQLDKVLGNLINLSSSLAVKGTGGGALADIDTLSYLPARGLSIAMALLTLNYFIISWRNNKAKIILITLTLSTLALVEESMFVPIFLTMILMLIFSLLPINIGAGLKKFRKTLFIIIFLTALITLLQGGFITDNLLHRKDSAFDLILPISSNFFNRFPKITTNYGSTILGIYNWLIPSPLLLLIPGFLYGLYRKKAFLIYITFYALICFSLFLSIEYKYEPSNNIRFYNFGFIASGISFSYFLFLYFSKRSTMKNLIFLIIFVVIIGIPSLLPEIIRQIQKVSEGKRVGIVNIILTKDTPTDSFTQIGAWAKNNLPKNARVLILDEGSPSPGKILEFEYKGIYTTLGPNDIRVLRQEPGVEFIDLTLTINPTLLKLTQTNYVYIESKSKVYQQLPKLRKDQLNDPVYFTPLIYIKELDNQNFSALYLITSEFLNSFDIKEGTLTYLQKLIPISSTVYVSDYPRIDFWYRMALSLALKDHDLIINNSQTRYMAIETKINGRSGKENEEYSFYLIGPDEKPNFPAELIWSNIYATAWKRN